MSSQWPEIDCARKEKRHELNLHGEEISKRIQGAGIDNGLYSLVNLNYLEITQTCLECLSDDIGNLMSLTSLLLQSNHLTSLPRGVGKLHKLKTLNLSNNKLETLPDELAQLQELHLLNVSNNSLSSFPNVEDMKSLHVLNLANNELTTLPDGICSAELLHLREIRVNSNKVAEIPEDLSNLPQLTILDLASNQITIVPPELSECVRLKDFNLKDNKIKDRKLLKLVEQNKLKATRDYLASLLSKDSGSSKGKKDKKSRKDKKKTTAENDDRNAINILHFPANGVSVGTTIHIQAVRPYIICCVIRNLDLNQTSNMFKHFITLQTKLHETVCQKRQGSTIATHDFQLIKLPLTYDARNPLTMMLTPLFRQNPVSAASLVKGLMKEADDIRKEKKRSTLSGIHKYLDLLTGQTLYPCVVDGDGDIISFPPITNCKKTQISADTKEIFVEVTSSTNMEVCKKTMEALLTGMLDLSLGKADDAGDSPAESATGDGVSSSRRRIIVEQVKVLDDSGSMKAVYPSRTDLQLSEVNVMRDYE